MRAKVTAEFKALRNPEDRKNSTIEVGEILEGALAKAAVDNGYARQITEGGQSPDQRRTETRRKRGEGEGEGV